jgi:caffeoyl-CoA O-methyltransferase
LDILPEIRTAYAEKYSSAESDLLKNISVATMAAHPQHHMLSGHLQGRLLAMLSRLMAPQWILEIGSFTGYSALCLAEGLSANGQLHTIEIRPAEAAEAKANFQLSPWASQIFLHEGEAKDIIPSLPYTWDLVFIDADKTGYLQYYEMILPNLKKGGLIIADNVLFHNEVLKPVVSGKNAKAIQAFNDFVCADDRVNKLLLTLRDGLLLLQKK